MDSLSNTLRTRLNVHSDSPLQAIGAIATLRHKDGRSLTINVEYNQLDPLLRSTINKEGDVNDKTGKCVRTLTWQTTCEDCF